MVSETITREVAAAEVTDDCMVEVRLRRPRLSLFPASAREFAAEVLRAADEADRASAELLHPVTPAKFDTAAISPDCRDGKHLACTGDAWDRAADHETSCDCTCHWTTITEEQAA